MTIIGLLLIFIIFPLNGGLTLYECTTLRSEDTPANVSGVCPCQIYIERRCPHALTIHLTIHLLAEKDEKIVGLLAVMKIMSMNNYSYGKFFVFDDRLTTGTCFTTADSAAYHTSALNETFVFITWQASAKRQLPPLFNLGLTIIGLNDTCVNKIYDVKPCGSMTYHHVATGIQLMCLVLTVFYRSIRLFPL